MIPLNLDERATLDGQEYPNLTAVLGDGILKRIVTVPAAKVGQLTTRTDADTGVLTMAGGHGLQQGDRLDVYWGSFFGRRGMTITNVDTNLVSVDGGAGDDLPTNLTAITAAVPVQETFACDGDDVVALLLWGDQRGTIVIVDDQDAELYALPIGSTTNVGRSAIWHAGRDPVNPLDGAALATAYFSHRATSQATFRLAVLLD